MKPKKKKITSEMIFKADAMREEGYTQNEIATEMKLSQTMVSMMLRVYDALKSELK